MRMGGDGRAAGAVVAQIAKPSGSRRVSTLVASPRVDEAVKAEREPTFLLAKPEKRLLRWIAGRLPRWILPDDLTALGVLAAFAICGAYQLSNDSLAWLWVASGLLVVHWLGDSLDGTLARVRGIERPRYGFYLDHLVDAVSVAAIGIGLGLSPFMLLSVGTIVVVAYLVLSINVYLESYALGRFSIGYGLIGPTELRLVLIALNTALALHLGLDFSIGHLDMTVFDLVGLGLAATMLALLAGRVVRNLRDLADREPAAPRRAKPRRSRRARPSSSTAA
jgi:phosphatidylglycerophosphate synthase